MAEQPKNPYFKFLLDTTKIPDPNNISLRQFEKYESYNVERNRVVLKRFYNARYNLAITFGLMIVGCACGEYYARHSLFGADNRGGDYLEMHTLNSPDDYSYNREFQRIQFVAEGNAEDPSTVNPKMLNDLGINVPQYGLMNVRRRSPHPKYYST